MKQHVKSIRTFIGAKNYEISRRFYHDFGFEEIRVFPTMSYFKMGDFGFYLQDAYVKDWIENSMIFIEVNDLETQLKTIKSLQLDQKYENVRVTEISCNDWGNEFFVYDPSGILWHIGEFSS
ncbi:glyoxalase [uncultured Kordia sp.]|uniref:glyoxalase n=1 Tax=uncultured Kordia sp. TaxID=507699 RepID=UPI00261B9954|nr:glyoxalase [uncultured Kordia sp.]